MHTPGFQPSPALRAKDQTGVLCRCGERVTVLPAGTRAITSAAPVGPGETAEFRSVTCPSCSAPVRVAVARSTR